MCWSRNSKTLSWLAAFWGLLSLVTLLIAFLSNVWLYTKEPIRFSNNDILTTVTFRIGLWRICPTFKLTNSTPYIPHVPCTPIKYSSWEDITTSDLGISTPLEFTPLFLSKMRISTPFGAVSIILIFLATAFALVGLYNRDHKAIVACGLFILGGLTLGGGLLIFASVLSDAYFERPKKSQLIISGFEKITSSSLFDYKYGWSFFAAGAAFFMVELAAVISITAYVRRFPTVEDMVRIMVPGAERKLKEQHGLASKYLTQQKSKGQRLDTDTSVLLTSGSKNKSEALSAKNLEETQGAMFLNKPAPDICTSNASALPESIITFGSQPSSSEVLVPTPGVYCMNSETSYILGEIDSIETNSPLRGNLAGHTVPIVLMHHSQRSSPAEFMVSAPNKKCKSDLEMSALPSAENSKTHNAVAFLPEHLLCGTDGEMSCFDQNFYLDQCSEFEDHLNKINFGLRHLNSELKETETRLFGTFYGERSFAQAGTLDQFSDVPGTFSSTSSSSGTGSGTTVTTDSSQNGLFRKRDFATEKKRKKNVPIGTVFSKMDTSESKNWQENHSFDCRNALT